MYWHRLLPVLQGLWPAALVWATLVLPTIAMQSRALRALIEPMPWWMRSGLWAVEHTWPYSRMVGMSMFTTFTSTATSTFVQTGRRFGPYCWCQRSLASESWPMHDPFGDHCPMCRLPLMTLGSLLPEFFLHHVLQTHFPAEEEAAWVRGEFLWLDRQPLHVWLDRQSDRSGQ